MLEQYIEAIEQTNIISKTDPQGFITFVNDEFCAISGYSKEELIGKNHNIVRHPDVPKENFERLWKTIKAKKIYKATVKNKAKDGSTFYVNTTIVPILDPNGEICEYVAIRYDVTNEMLYKESLEKKEKELQTLNLELEKRVEEKTKELLRLNADLQQRIAEEVAKNESRMRMIFWHSRLASMGEMLANIAHQWRQPLAELGIALFELKEALSANDPKNIETIYSHSQNLIANMSQTIENFATFFRPDKKREPFSIKQSIKEAIKIENAHLKRSMVDLKLSFVDEATVLGIPNELTQVFVNLLRNSLDAFEENGILLREIVIRSHITHEHCRIEYTDNGGGIETKKLYKIFEPYYTTKHKTKGTGLGLFIAKMICEEGFNGSIEVRSKHRRTTFTILLPRWSEI